MPDTTLEPDLLEHLKHLASVSPVPLAGMSMEEIARALGITRMTLYRKAGTRAQIVSALRGVGIDARGQPDVVERVVMATVELLRTRPIAELTLELIADHAQCSLPAIHARFGGRQGVLKAVVERHSPLFPVKHVITNEMDGEQIDLRHDIRLLYRTLFTHLTREWCVLRSFMAEVLRDPDSEVALALRNWYLPQVTAVLVPLIRKHLDHGTIRRLPVPIIIQMLAAPMGLHVASRDMVISEMGFELPDANTTIEIFTDLFCRSLAPEEPA